MTRIKVLLAGILVLAAFLRIWGLDKVPPELFGDELDVGYQAYSILKTGRDYYGQFLPTYIHSFSEWRAPLLMYVTFPFVAVFGLNEWGVRLPSAVLGVLSVWLIYLVVKKISLYLGGANDSMYNNAEKVALLTSFFLAFNQWHLQYSRAAFEVSLLLTLILSATLLFLKSFDKSSNLILSAIPFALTFYTYSTANVFTPLLIALLIVVFSKEIAKVNPKHKIIAAVVFVILSIPIAYNIAFGKAAERFNRFSVFGDEAIISEINNERIEGGLGFVETLSHNKLIAFARKILSNYATAFSPQFLFIEGDITFRHSIHRGEMFWVMLPLLLLGIYKAVKEKGKGNFVFLGWLLIAPIPASLTRDGAVHATRLFVSLPPLIYFSALGFHNLTKLGYPNIIKKGVLIFIILGFLTEMFLYLHQYWVHYPKQSWRWWHIGYKESMNFMKDNEGKYKLLVFNNTYEPVLIRYLFWWQYPPDKFQKEFSIDKPQENILPGFSGFSLENKYYFGTAKDTPGGVIEFVKSGILYLVSQRDEVGGDWDWEKNTPQGIKVLKTVRNPYNEPIFYIVTGI